MKADHREYETWKAFFWLLVGLAAGGGAFWAVDWIALTLWDFNDNQAAYLSLAAGMAVAFWIWLVQAEKANKWASRKMEAIRLGEAAIQQREQDIC